VPDGGSPSVNRDDAEGGFERCLFFAVDDQQRLLGSRTKLLDAHHGVEEHFDDLVSGAIASTNPYQFARLAEKQASLMKVGIL
jgi:hypothetical protein